MWYLKMFFFSKTLTLNLASRLSLSVPKKGSIIQSLVFMINFHFHHTFYMSFIPPKSQLSQIEWKTKVTKDSKHCWDSGGMNFKMVPIIISLNLLFGPEIMKIQKNSEGWMVGVWDGDRWDLSHPFWALSHHYPTRRCTIKLPYLPTLTYF